MSEEKQREPANRAYKSYDEFRERFYETKTAEEQVGVSASFGKSLAKLVVDKAANDQR